MTSHRNNDGEILLNVYKGRQLGRNISKFFKLKGRIVDDIRADIDIKAGGAVDIDRR